MVDPAGLHQRGVDAANAGRLASARRLLNRAVAGADADRAARIEATAAYVDSELGDLAGALSRCDRALAAEEISEASRAVLHAQRGLIWDLTGDSAAALRDLTTAIGLHADPVRRARALLNRGMVHLDRGELAPADADFGAARFGFVSAAMPVQTAKCDHNRGIVAGLTGDLITALELMDSAAVVLAPLSEVSRAIGDADRALVLESAGLGEEAAELLADAVRLFGRERARRLQAECELRLARALLTTDPHRSTVLAARAARRFDAIGSHGWAARARGVRCAGRLLRGRPRPVDIDAAVTTLEELATHDLAVEHRYLSLYLARAQARVGRLDDAATVLAGQRLDPGLLLSQRLLLHHARADLAAAGGDRTSALRHVRRGLDELHRWQSTFGSVEMRSSIIGHGRQLAATGVSLALAGADPRRSLEWSERTGALLSRIGAVLPATDPEQDQRLTELRVLYQRDAIDPATRRRQAELRTQIRRAAWRDRSAGELLSVASLTTLQRALRRAGAAYLGYLVDGDRLTAITVIAGCAAMHPLGELREVERAVVGLLPTLNVLAEGPDPVLRNVIEADLADRLRQISDRIVGPMAATLSARRLVLVAPPELAGLPWGMLPGLRGRSISLVPSASWWVNRSATPIRLRSACLLAGPDVPRGITEVSAAGHLWQRATMLTGGAASVAGLRAGIVGADLLHVAAHGRHSAASPLFSGIDLADGPFFGHDIASLDQAPLVVVLSACELGRTASHFGQETLGLTTAWLQAGTRCVLASPAVVDDTDAARLLTEVHRRLALGEAPADALADATRTTGLSERSTFVCHGSGW